METSEGVDLTVVGTVVAAIVVGAIFQLFSTVLGSRNVEPIQLLHAALIMTLVQYGLVSVMVFGRAATTSLRPRWAIGPAATGIITGVGIGGGTAALLLWIGHLATGRLTTDDRLVLLLSEGDLPRVLAVGFIVVAAAPLVEEVLFRGLFMEALRGSGRAVALWVTAAGFAVWHLNPSSLRYYTVMGLILGALYWRFGLSASISAHAAFNGALFVAALIMLFGPGQTMVADGVSLDAPGGWTQQAGAQSFDLAANGPSGSGLLIESVERPGAAMDVRSLAQQVSDGTITAAGATGVEVGSVGVVSYGDLDGVRLTVHEEGQRANVVIIPTTNRLWFVTLVGAGSPRAQSDFEQILGSLELAA